MLYTLLSMQSMTVHANVNIKTVWLLVGRIEKQRCKIAIKYHTFDKIISIVLYCNRFKKSHKL